MTLYMCATGKGKASRNVRVHVRVHVCARVRQRDHVGARANTDSAQWASGQKIPHAPRAGLSARPQHARRACQSVSPSVHHVAK
eukprot:2788172-Alexandrium_andersonii.AAC.1